MQCSSFGIDFLGYPTKVVGREALMALDAGYALAALSSLT
jgi:hypothetical protein